MTAQFDGLIRARKLPLPLLAVGCLIWQAAAIAQTRPAQAWDDPAAVVGKTAASSARTDNFLLYGYDKEPYHLDPGPHLFVDYRYILPGRTGYIFPNGKEAPRYGGDVNTL